MTWQDCLIAYLPIHVAIGFWLFGDTHRYWGVLECIYCLLLWPIAALIDRADDMARWLGRYKSR